MGGGGSRCQLADYRYGREDMLALYEKGLPPPQSLSMFPPIYSEQVLPPLALVPATDEERQWAARAPSLGPSTRGGRGAPGIGERGGRGVRGARGAYQPFGRALGAGYDGGSGGGGGGWGGVGGEQTEWSPRKDFTYSRSTSSGGIDNWRRNNRTLSEDEDGWRNTASHGRGGGPGEKWNRASSWREGEEDARDKRWHEQNMGATRGGGGGHRRMWDAQDEHLPEWATENLAEGGGTFDSSGAFHGSDDEHERGKELQKSASQHNIRNQHAPLVTSKSAVALSINKNTKTDGKEEKNARYHPDLDETKSKERTVANVEREMRQEQVEQSHRKATRPIEEASVKPPASVSTPAAVSVKSNQSNNTPPEAGGRVVDEDFDKLQEDFVSKLVVDEEPRKNVVPTSVSHPNVSMSNGIPAPPPNIMPPPPPATQEIWYYQDPQGDLQGPFLSSEMAEWFKAGYFTTTLFVRRQCDERFYTLGELVNLSSGNPFLASVPMAPPKQEKFSDPDVAMHYQQQFLNAQMMRARPYGAAESWTGVPGFHRDVYAPPMMPPMGPDMIPPASTAAPMLQQILSQFKMPPVSVQPTVMDESLPTSNPMHLDPLRALVQQMGGLQSLQARLQPQGMPPPPSHGMPANGTVPPPKADGGKMEPTDFMQFMQQHAALGKPQPSQLDQRIDLDSLWKRNQYPPQQQAQQAQPPPPQQQQQQQQHPPPPQMQQANNLQTTPQWPQSDKPISMWDAPTVPQVLQGGMPPASQPIVNQVPEPPVNDASDKKNKKEEKKLKELEEKQAKKEAEEKRKQEQRKQELEKKQQEEKRKKEEERVRKEMEKMKKEAEEKRLKELAEKKRLKEQRKEEEARKKAAEELKKQEDEKERLAAKDRENEMKKAQAEVQRHLALAAAANQKPAKTAPWSQATNNQGYSLAEIQKIERERKAEQVLMLQQAQQRQLQQAVLEQVASPEKMNSFGVPLNWANKPMRPNHVKSLAEIQAEEQDRLLKQKEKEKAAQKEKETLSPPSSTSTIWSGQSLTWNNSDGTGFWDEPTPQPTAQKKPQQAQPVKQVVSRQPQQQQQPAVKKQPVKQPKEQANNNANSNNTEVNSSDEFTNWCIRTLASMNTQVDIPTFVSFLRSIESALDVRDYCREYLGEKPATQQFAAQFLEKRRSFKPKPNAHKDDMCSPAPAITPSTQHSNDFQEVKGKGKKVKKSKMLKVDARILGFNVTAAQDRINVGDRDYGEA